MCAFTPLKIKEYLNKIALKESSEILRLEGSVFCMYITFQYIKPASQIICVKRWNRCINGYLTYHTLADFLATGNVHTSLGSVDGCAAK